jgi:cell division septum initiation protein DivIVA
MSVFEPSTESDHHSQGDPPQFRVGVRGYDRQEVAAYVQELSAHLEDERQRAEQAERTIVQLQLEMTTAKSKPPSFEHLGVEAAKVLEQAGHSADLLIEEAEGQGKSIIEDARAQAAELVSDAEQRADQLRSEAHKEAKQALEETRETLDRMQREAEEERAEVTTETDRLQSFRDSLLKHLGRVRQDLTSMLGLSEDEADALADDTGQPVEERAERAEATAEPAGPAEAAAGPTGPAAGDKGGNKPEPAVTRGR